jgi:hypothetical protein
MQSDRCGDGSNADFGREMFEEGNAPHQNRLPFSLLLSFGQAKERRIQSGDPKQRRSLADKTTYPNYRDHSHKLPGYILLYPSTLQDRDSK